MLQYFCDLLKILLDITIIVASLNSNVCQRKMERERSLPGANEAFFHTSQSHVVVEITFLTGCKSLRNCYKFQVFSKFVVK